MTDIVAKIEALAQKSLDRSATDKQAAANQRKAAWSTIQTKAPELAQFMTDFNQAFGKPAAITIEIDKEVMVSQGAQADPKPYWDGKLKIKQF
jgi:hypothetical protein